VHSAVPFEPSQEGTQLRMAAGRLEDQDGPAGRCRLSDHVEGIRRNHDRLGESEKANIGIVSRAIPEEAGVARRQASQRDPQGRRGPAGGSHHEADARSGKPGEVGEEAVHIIVRETMVAAVAAGEDRYPRLRHAGQARIGVRAGSREPLGRYPVRRRQRHEQVRPAQAVVLRHPDQIGRPGAGPRILQEDREGRAPGSALDEAQIRHRPPPGGDEEVRKGRRDRALRSAGSVARVDGSKGREPPEQLTRSDTADLGIDPERLRNPETGLLVSGLPVGQDPSGRPIVLAQHSIRPP
jgi:hypothetical protein